MLRHHSDTKNLLDFALLLSFIDLTLADSQGELKVILNGKRLVKNVVLLAKANVSTNHVCLLPDGESVDDCVTSSGHEHTSEHVDRCCLTSTIVA